MVAASWRRLSSGTQNDIVLASDFSTTGRRDAGFPDFVGMLTPPRTVWETEPPQSGADWTVPGGEHVRRWVEDLPSGGAEVGAILGYCASSVYAAALAEHIVRRQPRPPRLVLFDPVGVTADSLCGQFHALTASLAVALGADEVRAAQERGAEARAGIDDLTELATILVEIFDGAGRVAFGRLGLDDQVSGELTDGFAAYMAYLVAASHIDPEPGWRTATAITSATPGPGARLTSREIRFDIPHADLLRSPAVAAAVAELLAEAGTTAR